MLFSIQKRRTRILFWYQLIQSSCLTNIIKAEHWGSFKDFTELFDKIDNNTSKELINNYSVINEILERHKDIKLNYKFDTFTEIIMLDVKKEVIEQLRNEDFRTTLMKVLPLPLNEHDEFIKKIKDIETKKEILKLFKDDVYCKTINFFISEENYFSDIANEDLVQDNEAGLIKLYKYFPPFGRLQEITSENCSIGSGTNYKYYLLARVDDLFTKEEGSQGKKSIGFTIRNKNFLVKENEFFDYDFLGKNLKTLQKPFRNWIYGEIFHRDLNDQLQASRNEFINENAEFRKFVKEFVQKTEGINTILRKAYSERKQIREGFFEPIKNITSGEGFKTIKKNIETMFGDDQSKIDKFNSNVINKLKRKDKKEWFDHDEYLLENILTRDINLKYGELNLIISNSQRKEDELIIPISGETARKTIIIPNNVFKKQQVEFLGKSFDVKFVYLGPEKSEKIETVNYNVTDKRYEILINMFNDNVKRYNINVLEVIILIDLAYENSDSKDDMKHYLLAYLQDNYRSTVNCNIMNRLAKYLAMHVNI